MAERRSARGRASGSGTGGSGRGSSGDAAGGAAPDASGEHGGSGDVRTAFISGNTFRARAVQYMVVDGDAMFEGDIVLGSVDQVERESEILKAELRGELAAGVLITGAQFRWPNCTIPYDIDPALPSQNRVTDAIAHWQSNTRFRFVLRTPANAAQYPDWVTFRPSGGCSSSVGRRGGQQFVNLGPGCTTGNTIHEIGHVVGLWHEQSREDRDAFVTINWANIQAGFEHNFDQHISDGDDVGPYDYGSIMHYPRNAFSSNGQDTIVPNDPNAQIGQRTALSANDIATVNTLCPKVTKEIRKEVVKEHIPETLKELRGETVKERFPETLKERNPETAKELSPETIKELHPETLKERVPETTKELTPETRKELIETTVETIGGETVTLAETVGPELPGQIVTNPAVTAGGGLPFAMVTPHVGLAGAGAALGAVGGGTGDPITDHLAALTEAVAALEAGQAEIAAQLAALLGQPGLQ